MEFDSSSLPKALPKLKFNKKVSVIIGCFFFSALFWLMIALSKEHTTHLKISVRYSNIPAKKVLENASPSTLVVEAKTTGFRILDYHYFKRRETVDVDVAAILKRRKISSDNVVVVPAEYLANDISEQYGNELAIQSFTPDSILLSFSK